MFGGGLFGQQPQQQQQGGGLFGAQPQQQQGGMFGAQPQQQQGGGLFGAQPQQQQGGGLFGAQPQQQQGGMFGAQPQQQQGGGLFGQQPQQQGGGLFGAQPQQQQGGMFGAQPQQQQGGGLFGNQPQQQQGGMFGAQPQQQQGGGLFGAQPQQQQQGGGLFGNQPQQQQGGLFGQQPQQQQGGGLFGAQPQQQQGGLFGAQPQQQQQGGLFGAQPQQQQGGLFGAQPQQQQGGGLFGAQPQQQQGGLFGTQPQQQQGGLFGTQPQQQQGGMFGAQPQQQQGGLFGAQPQQQQGGLFGNQPQQQQGGLFGAQPQQQQGGLFGAQPQQQQGGLFGAQPQQQQGGMFGNSSLGNYSQKPISNPNGQDQKTNMGFTDCISSISFNPHSVDMFAASSWDKSIRVFNINMAKTMTTTLPAPVLSCAWLGTGTSVAAGCCDNTVKIWDVSSNKVTDIGRHNQPVSRVLPYQQNPNVLFSTSWDGSIYAWDLRSPTGTPVNTINLPSKILAADIQGDVLAAVTGDCKYYIYSIPNMNMPPICNASGLNSQPRTCALTSDQSCLAMSSAEGRCTVKFFRQPQNEKDRSFTFKCHRPSEYDVHCTNGTEFHPKCTSVLATVGSDGFYFFWDKDRRQRLHPSLRVGQPLTCAKFSIDGSFFAYAASYDWSLGSMPAGSYSHDIFVHKVPASEITPKKK